MQSEAPMQTENADPFAIKVRVYFEDTDAGGVVYNANYVKFIERARTEWLRHRGYEQRGMLESGLGFVIASLEVSFKKPARLDDELTVTCEVETLMSASVTFRQTVLNQEGELLVSARARSACVDMKAMKPCLFPPELKMIFAGDNT